MLNALGLGYSESKIKPYLKMAVQRIQIANNKKTTSVKHQKREVATLLGEQKDEKARIKVEHIIRDDFVIEAYEMLELLCELMHERIRLVTTHKDCPPDLKESVCSLIWAAGNCDISELQEVKKHLIRKYGAEFGKEAEENANCCVNARLYNKLSYKPASRILVNGYLEEIANVYKIDWTPPIELEGELVVDEAAPFSTPTGYSVNMAPGSGLTSAYSRAAASATNASPAAAKSGKVVRTLSPEEQEEYDQFQKNQTKAAASVPSAPSVVYAPIAGAPPRFHAAPAPSTALPAPVARANAAPAVAAVPEPLVLPEERLQPQSPAKYEYENEYEYDEQVQESSIGFDLPPAAPATQVHCEQAQAQTQAPGEYSPPPFAPGQTPPATPPAPPAAPAAPVDPMEAMLARLAALK